MLNRVRQLKKESHGVKTAGFTIIEVMIVLAIAGLIMAIVFLAIPALQRNNRNTQRKNDVSRVAGQINDYVANNNGKLPTSLIFTGTAAAGELDLTKETYSIMDTGATATVAPNALTADLTITAAALANKVEAAANTVPCVGANCASYVKADNFWFFKNANCAGTNVPKKASSTRSFALWYGIEGNTLYQCIEE